MNKNQLFFVGTMVFIIGMGLFLTLEYTTGSTTKGLGENMVVLVKWSA